jgi:hypothetical protein
VVTVLFTTVLPFTLCTTVAVEKLPDPPLNELIETLALDEATEGTGVEAYAPELIKKAAIRNNLNIDMCPLK